MWNKLKCGFLGHAYTSAVEQGIKPTPEQLSGGVAGFMDYVTMYCSRCGHVYVQGGLK